MKKILLDVASRSGNKGIRSDNGVAQLMPN